MRRVCTFILLVATLTVGASTAGARDNVSSDTCLVDNAIVNAAECQSIADSSWEGLSMEEQTEIHATGLKGTPLDQYVIDYRSTVEVIIIPPTKSAPQIATELPRTS